MRQIAHWFKSIVVHLHVISVGVEVRVKVYRKGGGR